MSLDIDWEGYFVSLETLSLRPVAPGRRRIAVLADMLQLGPNSEDFHKALADPIPQSGADRRSIGTRSK